MRTVPGITDGRQSERYLSCEGVAMKKWVLRTTYAILAILMVPALIYHLGLRQWCLRWGATKAELQSAMPGDDLLPDAAMPGATHAITIHAGPEKIWPWLMQIGQDRSGFYSYTFLENAIGCDMPKVERLVQEWKPRTVGEAVWFCNPKRYQGRGKMVPVVVDSNHALALVMANDWKRLETGSPAHDGLWSFTLIPTQDGQTRLIARARGATPPSLSARLMGRLFWEPAHFVMEQKMLRTIRDLSERG
jgi:hypothetical protein